MIAEPVTVELDVLEEVFAPHRPRPREIETERDQSEKQILEDEREQPGRSRPTRCPFAPLCSLEPDQGGRTTPVRLPPVAWMES